VVPPDLALLLPLPRLETVNSRYRISDRETERRKATEEVSPVRGWKVLVSLVAIGGFVTLLAYGFTKDPRAIPTPLTGQPASDFTLTLFDGRIIRLSDFRGKVVFLNFWASWCPPCREEAPLLEQAWHRYKDQGIVFLGVDFQDTDEAARSFLREFGITYMNGRDPTGRIAIDYGVYGIPETFFIDREGRITYKHIGALDDQVLVAKLTDAQRGLASAEGKSEGYQSITVR
jgi:cytochrome c biogenesis protein CcmG/thiol:disulfide interchange protein DsbE